MQQGLYNQRRIHSSIGYKTPVDVESNLMMLRELAYVESRQGQNEGLVSGVDDE